jgi:hypothetical protein
MNPALRKRPMRPVRPVLKERDGAFHGSGDGCRISLYSIRNRESTQSPKASHSVLKSGNSSCWDL